eukprot:SAG31_NODE_50_length_30520_cov_89.906712_18_plen_149_part_00
MVKDRDALMDDLVGFTTVELIDRFFSQQWRHLGHSLFSDSQRLETSSAADTASTINKPIERRTLHLPGNKAGRGKLEMWIDIFTEAEAKKNYPVNIARSAGEHFVCLFMLLELADASGLRKCGLTLIQLSMPGTSPCHMESTSNPKFG